MAQEKKQSKPVALYSPKGARVSVPEGRAERYQALGYRKTKPKATPKHDEVAAAMRAEVEAEVRAEIEAEKAEAAKAPEKK